MATSVEGRGETGGWDRRLRGRRWPWQKMLSAGARSRSKESLLLCVIEVFGEELGVGWRVIVKENSWEGEDRGDGCWFGFWFNELVSWGVVASAMNQL